MSKIIVLTDVLHAAHYRTTITGPSVSAEVFAEIECECEHYFADLDRFGHGYCAKCKAHAWSESWVADGVFGEDTHSWADETYRMWCEEAQMDAAAEVAVEIIANLSPDEPARRPGIPVPQMEFMRLA